MTRCRLCGTEYFQPVAECDWCPGEKPVAPLVPNPCSICDEPIYEGAFIGTGDGSMRNGGSFAHAECYRAREAE